MKGLIHKHTIPIYGRPIRICFHKETFEKLVGYELGNYVIGHSTLNDKEEILLYFIKNHDGSIPADILAHERYHAVDYFLEITGVDHVTNGSNEHCAYLIGYLVNKVLDALELDNEIEFKLSR